MKGEIYIQPRVLLAWERCDALEGKDDGNIHYPTRLASRPKYFIIQAWHILAGFKRLRYTKLYSKSVLYRCRHENVSTHSKPEESAWWSWRSAWLQRRGNRSCEFLPRRASQFDPTIDKERKFISNLRWNMSVFAQTVPNVPLQEQPNGKNWLNSRYAQKSAVADCKSRG